MAIGFTLPFAQSSGSLGYFEMTNDELSAVKENIKSILVTNWGERVMRYNFGCNLIEFLFERDRSDELRQRIADRISSQITLWLPFVFMQELNVIFPEDSAAIPQNAIGIRIKFVLTGRPDLSAVVDMQLAP